MDFEPIIGEFVETEKTVYWGVNEKNLLMGEVSLSSPPIVTRKSVNARLQDQ
jgi:hypothetical protein